MPNKKRVEITPQEEIEYRRKHMSEEDFGKWLKAMMSEAIQSLFYLEEQEDADAAEANPMVITELLAIVGFEWVEDCGCRGGDVRFVLPDGGIPMWKADGLLSAAQKRADMQRSVVAIEFGGEDDAD